MILVLISVAAATEWTVELDGSGDFSTVSDALDASAAGDTIRIGIGSFGPSSGERLPYYFPSGVTIVGRGRDVTVLDAEGADSFGWVIQTGVEISSVTLRGARDTALVVTSDLYLNECAFFDNGGVQYAAVSGTVVTINDCLFEGNFASDAGGAILWLNAGSSLRAVTMLEDMSSGQQLLRIEGGGTISESILSGGLVQVENIENSLVFGAHGQTNGANTTACVMVSGAVNNTIVGCEAGTALQATSFALNNVIAHNAGAGLDGRYAAYNLLYDNAAGDFDDEDWTGQLGNLTGYDPLFRAFSDDGDWSNDDFRLQEVSTGIDAASADFPPTDIEGVPRPQDGNGDGVARADIGAYEWGEFDADGDGWYLDGGDCDDADPEVNPDANDLPYDGIDQDCDGHDLTDVDADGYDATYVGGDDCDDTDPGINPGAWDIPNDGIDQDCDGRDAVDADGDGWPDDQDCAPEDAAVYPGAEEVCNGVDDDCDGAVDGVPCDTGDADSDPVDVSGKECGCVGCRAPDPSSAMLLVPFVALMRRRRRA